FAFYFAILSAITPPVALAVYAAGSLAKAPIWPSGWAAVRIGFAGFLVPFMFVYDPSILFIGEWFDIGHAAITAIIGCIVMAAGLAGYFGGPTPLWARVALIAGALLMIKPGTYSDIAGVAIIVGVYVVGRMAARKAVSAPNPG
ncbi:MAG: C4-dicarboxylate ABC transporter permease, partial [Ferrovibrio sp.]